MKIEPNKFYRTRNGLQARIYATDAGGTYPIHGAVLYYGAHWIPQTWTREGRQSAVGGREANDLIAEWTDSPKDQERCELECQTTWRDWYPDYEGGNRAMRCPVCNTTRWKEEADD